MLTDLMYGTPFNTMIQLEEELGVKLFHRSKHRIVLTQEGMLLRRRAEEIISLANKTKEDLHHRQEQLSGTIAVGSGSCAAPGS